MNYAIIDKVSGEVLNCVAWDGDIGKWAPPFGTKAVRCQVAGRGDDWDEAVQKFHRVMVTKTVDVDGNISIFRERVDAPFDPQPEGGIRDQKERPIGWKPRALIELERRREEEREAARLREIDLMLGTIVVQAEEAARIEAEAKKLAEVAEAEAKKLADRIRAATEGVEGIEL